MSQEKIRDLLEDIKTASGKRRCDVFYYLKADQALKNIDASEASRRELLEACKSVTRGLECLRVKSAPDCIPTNSCCVCRCEAAIAKAQPKVEENKE